MRRAMEESNRTYAEESSKRKGSSSKGKDIDI
jgi:hypothetical protein